MWVRLSARYQVGFLRKKLIELRDHPDQLGKVGQKQMTTIAEELNIYAQLRTRLATVLSEQEVRVFWRTERGRQHFHWIVRALLRGDFESAARGWRAICRYGQPYAQALYWLATCNGRLSRRQGEVLFDKATLSATCS
jgi:hypothetical protein